MGDTTIEWTRIQRDDGTLTPGYTYNGWWGCEHAPAALDPLLSADKQDKSSPACDNCYAESFAKRVGHGDTWGTDSHWRFFADAHWNEPLKWQREAAALGEQHAVFCGSMMDIGEDRRELDPHRDRICALVEQTPNIRWLLLTKRPDSLRRLVPWKGQWPDNAWFGVTVEKRAYLWRADEALKSDAPVHFISYEPALGPVDFRRVLGNKRGSVQWLIFGTESGGRARVVPHELAHEVVLQCRETGASPFIKQLDAALLQIGRRGQAIKAMDNFPPDLRIREMPKGV